MHSALQLTEHRGSSTTCSCMQMHQMHCSSIDCAIACLFDRQSPLHVPSSPILKDSSIFILSVVKVSPKETSQSEESRVLCNFESKGVSGSHKPRQRNSEKVNRLDMQRLFRGRGNSADASPTLPAATSSSSPSVPLVTGPARPIRLVYCDEKGKFRMDPEAVATLQLVKEPIGVVSVCGRARQGKSFILNQVNFLPTKWNFGAGFCFLVEMEV